MPLYYLHLTTSFDVEVEADDEAEAKTLAIAEALDAEIEEDWWTVSRIVEVTDE